MKQLSDLIYKGLTEDTAVSFIVNDKVFPLIADQETETPFIVYRVSLNNPVTKERASSYTVEILSYHSSYNKSLELNEAVVDALNTVNLNGVNYRFHLGGATPLVDTDYRFYVKQIINIKK